MWPVCEGDAAGLGDASVGSTVLPRPIGLRHTASMRLVLTAAAAIITCSATAACGAPPPDSPSAVIQPDPWAVCLGDDFRTVITLDGAQSTPRLTLVPTPPAPGSSPLRYRWRLSGAAYRVVGGSLSGPELRVTTAADRPLHASLTVEDDLGGVAVIDETVAITLPDPDTGECPVEPDP